VWRAAQRLWDAAGREGEPRDAVVRLEKRIPMQAGLGGGSSDAAAALRSLRDIWKLRVADEELFALAARLGSDVPFFFLGGTALGLGRGEEVYPLADLPRWWVVLVIPPFGVATADAYEWLDHLRARSPAGPETRYLPGTWLGKIVPLVNDLERPVIERHPVVATLTGRLTRLGAVMAAMSGSGSTVFGIFTTASAADKALRALRKTGAHALVTRMLGRRRARKPRAP
jgi:4-diphosphocytidyl-2-C-methyl-D-erythritol kinase